MKNKEQNNS